MRSQGHSSDERATGSLQFEFAESTSTGQSHLRQGTPDFGLPARSMQPPQWWLDLRQKLSDKIPDRWQGVPFPWFKLVLLGIGVYILTFKDLRLSIDMKAPLASLSQGVQAPPHSSQTTWKGPHFTDAELKAQRAYIKRFDQVARAEMRKYGIPASVKMAQAVIESRSGQSVDAREHRNHFGIPLSGVVYDNAWANWRAHSELLKRDFPELFRLGGDAKKWAEGLEASGYSDATHYAHQLMAIIEAHDLTQLDQ